MTTATCRACKKRPVPERKPLLDESKAESEEALEQLRETNAEVEKRRRGLCYECHDAAFNARFDQSMAYMKEKSRLGQCIIRDCAEPRTPTERCVGHQAQFEAMLT